MFIKKIIEQTKKVFGNGTDIENNPKKMHFMFLFLPCNSPVGPFDGTLVSFKHFEHSFNSNN